MEEEGADIIEEDQVNPEPDVTEEAEPPHEEEEEPEEDGTPEHIEEQPEEGPQEKAGEGDEQAAEDEGEEVGGGEQAAEDTGGQEEHVEEAEELEAGGTPDAAPDEEPGPSQEKPLQEALKPPKKEEEEESQSQGSKTQKHAPTVPSFKPKRESDVVSQADSKKKQKYSKAYPFRARYVDEKKIMQALLKVPESAKHPFFGYIYSAESERCNKYQYLPLVKQPQPRQHVHVLGMEIPKGVIQSSYDAPRNLMPLSTVKVQWGIRINSTVYTIPTVYAYLLRFGIIDTVYPLSNNSALIVFATLHSARECIHCRSLGCPWDPIIADWYEPRMKNGAFFQKYADIESEAMMYEKLNS